MLADFKIKPDGGVIVSIGNATANVSYETLVELTHKAALAKHQLTTRRYQPDIASTLPSAPG